jgi:hypothetical protein
VAAVLAVLASERVQMPIKTRNGLLLRDGEKLAASDDCCCQGEPGVCVAPTQWRIVDENGNLYAQGVIDTLVDPYLMVDFPGEDGKFPPFYWETGQRTYKLEVTDCGNGWAQPRQVTDPGTYFPVQWDHDLQLCNYGSDRYITTSGGLYLAPEGCDCKTDADTGEAIEPCEPCPQISALPGTGQAWRSPPHTKAHTFTGSTDGEWTNLLNWEDENGNSPAISLPEENDGVVINGEVTSTAIVISVGHMHIGNGGNVIVAASVESLFCEGTVGREGSECETIGEITIAAGGTCEFDGGTLDGKVVLSDLAATFINSSVVGETGVLEGNANFTDSGVLDGGEVTGSATFSSTGENRGTIGGNATFNDATANETNGVVSGNAVFVDSAENRPGATVEGNAEFENTSANLGDVDGNAEFADASENRGTGIIGGDATFNDTSVNIGTVNGDGTFGGSAKNTEAGGFGQVLGNATFSGTSVMESGEVGGNATFTDTAKMQGGFVSGVLEFTDSSTNEGGNAVNGNFYDSSVMSAGQIDNAQFSGTSSLTGGYITDLATFTGTASLAGGTAGGNATFSGSAQMQSGSVTGVATFTGSSCYVSGTAGTFDPDPPPDC